MKLTNSEMLASEEVLSMANEKGKLGYACARNLRKIRDCLTEFYNVRQDLFEKYGEENENSLVVPEEKREDFVKELNEFLAIEHDVDVFQVDEEVFCSGNFTTSQMYTLDWMVKKEV